MKICCNLTETEQSIKRLKEQGTQIIVHQHEKWDSPTVVLPIPDKDYDEVCVFWS